MFYATIQGEFIVYPLILDNKGYTIGQLSRKDINFIKDNKSRILDILNNRQFYKDKSKSNLYRVRYKRVSSQMKAFIYKSILCGLNTYFATFTFSNDYLPFNREQFRKYMQRTKLINFILYVDYGTQTNRFHLHGFVSCINELDNQSLNKFGYTKLFRLSNEKFDIKKMIKYCVDYSIVAQYKFTLFKSFNNIKKDKFKINLENLKKVVDIIC